MNNSSSGDRDFSWSISDDYEGSWSECKWVMSDIKIQYLLNEYGTAAFRREYFSPKKTILIACYFVYIKSFFITLGYYVRQLFILHRKDLKINKRLIIGADREYRHYNINKIKGNNFRDDPVINGFDLVGLMRIKHVSIVDIYRQFLHSVFDFHKVITMGFSGCVESIILDGAARKIAAFTYLNCFFRKIQSTSPECVIYTGSGGSLLSYVTTSLGLRTVYITHGLISKIDADLFPNFSRIYVYSNDERQYLIKAGVRSNIETYDLPNVGIHSKSVIIFMNNDGSDNYDEILSIINYFKSDYYSIYIKYHPLNLETSEEYSWVRDSDISIIDNAIYWDSCSSIGAIKPSFVVGNGVSTSLCEALCMGVIPIRINQSAILDEWDYNWDGIYPYEKRTFSWHDERDVINKLLSENTQYSDAIRILRNR